MDWEEFSGRNTGMENQMTWQFPEAIIQSLEFKEI